MRYIFEVSLMQWKSWSPSCWGRVLSKSKRFVTVGLINNILTVGARCSSVVRAFAHGAMGRRIDPSWWTH